MGGTELSHRLRAGPSHVWQVLNDLWLNIDTGNDPGTQSDELERHAASDHRSQQAGANYLYLEQIAKLVTNEALHPLVFYDVGCGKGRPLCVMARHPFAKVVGVEPEEDLCEIARRNARSLRGRVAPIEVVRTDAASLDYSDGHVFFFFNPFGPSTLRAVLDSIERSLVRVPRRVTVIYYDAVFETVFNDSRWLECYGILPTFSRVRVTFWRNRRLAEKRGPSA